jgi:hypothetical protein
MEKLTPQERALVVSLYKSLKSNPKTFSLEEKDKATLVGMLDLDYFDINFGNESLTYYSYDIGVPLTKNLLDKDATHGEDSRALFEALRIELSDRFADILVEIYKGNVPDAAAVSAAYLHMGIAHDVILSYYSIYGREDLTSDVARAARRKLEEEKCQKELEEEKKKAKS